MLLGLVLKSEKDASPAPVYDVNVPMFFFFPCLVPDFP